jgi:hypothetical protein
MPKPLSLPTVPDNYDREHHEATQRLLEQHLSTLQPAQQRQKVTGAKGGNAALASLLTALANLGFIVDGTTA